MMGIHTKTLDREVFTWATALFIDDTKKRTLAIKRKHFSGRIIPDKKPVTRDHHFIDNTNNMFFRRLKD